MRVLSVEKRRDDERVAAVVVVVRRRGGLFAEEKVLAGKQRYVTLSPTQMLRVVAVPVAPRPAFARFACRRCCVLPLRTLIRYFMYAYASGRLCATAHRMSLKASSS